MFVRINKDSENELYSAYIDGDLDKFKSLIYDGADVNCIARRGRSLISEVVRFSANIEESKNRMFFDELLKSDVLLCPITEHQSILSESMDSSDPYYMEQLLKKDIDVNSIGGYVSDTKIILEEPVIFSAISDESVDKIKALIEHGLDLFVLSSLGETVLQNLMQKSDSFILNLFEHLLKSGADINQKDLYGRTCLHKMVLNIDNEDIFNIAFKNNVDINAQDNYGNTPLMIACQHGKLFAINLLIKNKACVNMQNFVGKTAAMHCVKNVLGPKSLEILSDVNPDFSKVSITGSNICHHIASECSDHHEYYMKFLKKHSELLTKKNNNNNTPLDNMKIANHPKYSDLDKFIKENEISM